MRKFWLFLLLWVLPANMGGFIKVSLAQEVSLPTLYLQPTWSPDGQLIAYLSSDGIYVMGRDGDHVRQISSPAGFEGWTPDSQALIINTGYINEGSNIWIYPVDGSAPSLLLPEFERIYRLAYSSDGQLAFYASKHSEDAPAFWVLDESIVPEPMLVGDTVFSDYDVQRIEWTDKPDDLILTASLKTTGKKVLIDIWLAQLWIPWTPIRSLDEVTVTPLTDETAKDLAGDWQIDFDPAKSTPYVTFARRISHPTQGNIPFNHVIDDLTQSPNEKTLAYVSYCDPNEISQAFLNGEWSAEEQAKASTSLILLNLTDQTETTLVECGAGSQMFPAFSPDGSSLTYVTASEAGWQLYRVDLAADGTFSTIDLTPAA